MKKSFNWWKKRTFTQSNIFNSINFYWFYNTLTQSNDANVITQLKGK